MLLLLALACHTATPEPEPAPAPVAAPAAEAAPAGRIGGAPILDRPVVLGAMATPAVAEALEGSAQALSACFAPAAAAGRTGKVLLRFAIGGDGAVTRVETRATSLRHPEAEGCLEGVVRGVAFPAPENGGTVLVTWPFEAS